MAKQRIRLTESQLHNIIRRCVNEAVDEIADTRSKNMNLAGQASGALNSFGGKIRGMFDKKWKERKTRQANAFKQRGESMNYGGQANDYLTNRWDNENFNNGQQQTKYPGWFGGQDSRKGTNNYTYRLADNHGALSDYRRHRTDSDFDEEGFWKNNRK